MNIGAGRLDALAAERDHVAHLVDQDQDHEAGREREPQMKRRRRPRPAIVPAVANSLILGSSSRIVLNFARKARIAANTGAILRFSNDWLLAPVTLVDHVSGGSGIGGGPAASEVRRAERRRRRRGGGVADAASIDGSVHHWFEHRMRFFRRS